MTNIVRILPVILILAVFARAEAADLIGQAKEREIKSSAQYRWGEGTDTDPATAENAAMRDLVQKICVAVATSTGRKVVETEGSVTDTTRVEIATYSALQLTGLDKLRFTEGGRTRVIAFIDTANLSRSFELAKQKVRDLVAQALAAESERRIGDALRLTYWAYLTTFTYIGDDTLDLGWGVNLDARSALSDRMDGLVKGLAVHSEPCYREAGAVVALVRFNYNGQPVQNLDVRYYCGAGDDWAVVKNGQAYLTIYFEPSKRRWPLSLGLEYAYPTEMHRRSPEIENLYRILKERSFNLTLELELFAPWLPEEPSVPLPTSKPLTLPDAVPEPTPVASPEPVIRWSVTIQVLSGISDSREFRRTLQDYADMGYLVYAREPSQIAKNFRLFSALLDEGRVYALIYYDQNRLIDTRSGKVLSSLNDAFKGEAYQIWIGEPVK